MWKKKQKENETLAKKFNYSKCVKSVGVSPFSLDCFCFSIVSINWITSSEREKTTAINRNVIHYFD